VRGRKSEGGRENSRMEGAVGFVPFILYQIYEIKDGVWGQAFSISGRGKKRGRNFDREGKFERNTTSEN
jgi:hypothetical protein